MWFCSDMYLDNCFKLREFKVTGQGHRARFLDSLSLRDRAKNFVTNITHENVLKLSWNLLKTSSWNVTTSCSDPWYMCILRCPCSRNNNEWMNDLVCGWHTAARAAAAAAKSVMKSRRRPVADAAKRVYACKECTSKFTKPALLRRHLLIHTGNWLHTCLIQAPYLSYR